MSRTLDELTTYDITELISLVNAYDVWYRIYSVKLQTQDNQEKWRPVIHGIQEILEDEFVVLVFSLVYDVSCVVVNIL
jgi:hypothetical protein